jgi:hypothetical protein
MKTAMLPATWMSRHAHHSGAGSGTTIIQAGTNTTNGIDKVIAANPFCNSSVNVTIDASLSAGRNTQPAGASFSHWRGIDWCAGGSGNIHPEQFGGFR